MRASRTPFPRRWINPPPGKGLVICLDGAIGALMADKSRRALPGNTTLNRGCKMNLVARYIVFGAIFNTICGGDYG